MTREWKVYGWQGHRKGAVQTREIVAARSKAEAARLAGYRRPGEMFNLTTTGNAVEIAVAMYYSKRGCVCWRPLDVHDPLEWQRDPLRQEKVSP